MNEDSVINTLEREIEFVRSVDINKRCMSAHEQTKIISALRYAIAVIVDAKEMVPMRRATWIPDSNPDSQPNEHGEIKYFCSHCDCCDVHRPDTVVPYCWNCGSRMTHERDV